VALGTIGAEDTPAQFGERGDDPVAELKGALATRRRMCRALHDGNSSGEPSCRTGVAMAFVTLAREKKIQIMPLGNIP
jgi:hypothetical protein